MHVAHPKWPLLFPVVLTGEHDTGIPPIILFPGPQRSNGMSLPPFQIMPRKESRVSIVPNSLWLPLPLFTFFMKKKNDDTKSASILLKMWRGLIAKSVLWARCYDSTFTHSILCHLPRKAKSWGSPSPVHL